MHRGAVLCVLHTGHTRAQDIAFNCTVSRLFAHPSSRSAPHSSSAPAAPASALTSHAPARSSARSSHSCTYIATFMHLYLHMRTPEVKNRGAHGAVADALLEPPFPARKSARICTPATRHNARAKPGTHKQALQRDRNFAGHGGYSPEDIAGTHKQASQRDRNFAGHGGNSPEDIVPTPTRAARCALRCLPYERNACHATQ